MRKFTFAILCGLAAILFFGAHVAYAQAVPDPVGDPLAAVGMLEKLYRSGALVAAGILAAFFGLTYASAKIAWLQTDHRAVYVSAILGGLTLLVAPASQGTTPNLSMIIAAIVATFGLAVNPKLPATKAVGRGDLPPGADMPTATAIKGATGTLVLLVALGLGASQLTACSASTQQATLKAAYVTTTTACAGFVAYDLQHQEDLRATATSKDDALVKIDDWHQKRATVVAGCSAGISAIAAAAALQTDQSVAGMNAAVVIIVNAVKALNATITGASK